MNQLALPVAGDLVAIMHTNMGDISIRLFPDHAPKAVENFTTHAANGYYDGIQHTSWIYNCLERFCYWYQRNNHFGNLSFDRCHFQEDKKEKALTDMDDPHFGSAWNVALLLLIQFRHT